MGAMARVELASNLRGASQLIFYWSTRRDSNPHAYTMGACNFRWQLEQSTMHFAISFKIRSLLHPLSTAFDIVISLAPGWWKSSARESSSRHESHERDSLYSRSQVLSAARRALTSRFRCSVCFSYQRRRYILAFALSLVGIQTSSMFSIPHVLLDGDRDGNRTRPSSVTGYRAPSTPRSHITWHPCQALPICYIILDGAVAAGACFSARPAPSGRHPSHQSQSESSVARP